MSHFNMYSDFWSGQKCFAFVETTLGEIRITLILAQQEQAKYIGTWYWGHYQH